jgi:subtilisin family serine protease
MTGSQNHLRAITAAAALICIMFSTPAFALAHGKLLRSGKPVAGSYIVVLNDAAEPVGVSRELTRIHGGHAEAVFDRVFKGFTAKMTERQALLMLNDPRVDHIEEDTQLELAATTQAVDNRLFDLDRIDQRSAPPDSTYTYCQDGTGVSVYVVDSGVWRSHNEFTSPVTGFSRVTPGIDARYAAPNHGAPDNPCPYPWEAQNVNAFSCTNSFGLNIAHGTAVASVIGGLTYGVAKNVTIVPVRVLDCNNTGTVSNLIWAFQGILGQHTIGTPAVVNVSLVVPWDYAPDVSLQRAVNAVIDSGVPVVAAAGNQGTDASSYMPGNNPRVITVGGSDRLDGRWVDNINYPSDGSSNYGTVVDVFAPADALAAHMWDCAPYAPAPRSVTAVRTAYSAGTSFSCALVTGVVAQYLQAHPAATPAQVESWIVSNATTGVLSNTPQLRSANRLLFTSCQ